MAHISKKCILFRESEINAEAESEDDDDDGIASDTSLKAVEAAKEQDTKSSKQIVQKGE